MFLRRRNASTRLLLRLLIDFTILLLLFSVAFIAVPYALRTTQRGFFCGDTTLRYPYHASVVSKVHLTILVIALPAAVVLVIELLRAALSAADDDADGDGGDGSALAAHHNCDCWSVRMGVVTLVQQYAYAGFRIPTFISECYQTMGIYLFGFALEWITTELSKRLVGRLRPYFFDVCLPQRDEHPACGLWADSAYVERYECSELALPLPLHSELRHSFPSGYAASATYAMCFLVVYMQARLSAPWLRLARALAQLVCVALAALVALERLATFQNHWSDVAAGVLGGGAFAAYTTLVIARGFRRRQRLKVRHVAADVDTLYGYPASRLSAKLHWQQ